MSRNKSIATGAKGIKKPASKSHNNTHTRKRVVRHAVIKTGSMHKVLRHCVRDKKPGQNKEQFRVSRKAAIVAAHAVEDIMDMLLRNGCQLKNEIVKAKMLKPEHLLYVFREWAKVHLALPATTERFTSINRFVDVLDMRRRSTTGAAALAHAMKHVHESSGSVAAH